MGRGRKPLGNAHKRIYSVTLTPAIVCEIKNKLSEKTPVLTFSQLVDTLLLEYLKPR